MELHGKGHNAQNTRKTIFLVAIALVLLGTIPLCYNYNYHSIIQTQSIDSSKQTQPYHAEDVEIKVPEFEECDIFSGEWVPDPEAPYYTNSTCWAIHEHQNCMKYGRPDTEFMRWRWQPDDCDLPSFSPSQFLNIVRGKSMAFVGDSVGRNQMQSLICMLSRVEYPIIESHSQDEKFIRWRYPNYNFTLAAFWSPFLVKVTGEETDGPIHKGLFNVHLDEIDEKWTTQIEDFDYVIISGGHWFYRPSMYYEKSTLVGCRFCQVENVIDLPVTYGLRRAFKTAFKAINSLKNFKGITILRTFAPSHFEGGDWNEGGNCVRQKPFFSNETEMGGMTLDIYLTQIEEFRAAEREGKEKELRYRLLDTTQSMLLRPDGHPSKYGHWPHENVDMANDCVHWCLPGPIDSWSDFLLHMLKEEGRKSYHEIIKKREQQ